jgi:uncharacterized membrane protein YgaE (UPF0421/DUF939 family)
MTKQLMAILLILGGVIFLLISALSPPQQSASTQKASSLATLKESLHLRAVENSDARIENSEKSPNDEHKKTNQQSIRVAIADIETELKNADALERLNANVVKPDERIRLGQKLQHLDHLRVQELEQQLATIEKEVADLTVALPARLKTYGATKP